MKLRFDRLDRAALLFMAALLVLIAFVVLRGDQVGVQITATTPTDGAMSVGMRTQLAANFSEPMPVTALDGRLLITPALSGTLRWKGATAFYATASPLQADTIYTVTVRAGARSLRDRVMLRDASWSFRTGHPRLVYLAPATTEGDLYVQEINATGSAHRITSEPYGVFDFAVSPDGQRIVYSATRNDSLTRDLWVIGTDGQNRERLLACDEQVCQTPSWSADSTRVAFERRNLVQGAIGKTPGAGRIWIYDFTSRSAAALFGDSQQLGSIPHWAPVGERLSYYDPVAGAVTAVDTTTGDRAQLPSVLGDPGTWSPDGLQLIYPDLRATDSGEFNQLLRADLVTNIITPVMPLSPTNDLTAVWSPYGNQIAFSRQSHSNRTATAGFTPFGPQIWIAMSDGQDAHAITAEPEFSYSGLSWSPDGLWIAAVRNNLTVPNPAPEVWLVRADGTRKYRLADNATLPAWIP